MAFAVVFSLFAACCTVLAIWHGGWTWVLLWPTGSFLMVAAAYTFRLPGLMGKRASSGRIHPIALILLAPYFLLTWNLWHVFVWATGSRESSLAMQGLWLGRRPRRGELPLEVTTIVDLTCEFPSARGLVGPYRYLNFPILDGHVPTLDQLLAATAAVVAHEGVVYLHCAQGHGRTALVAACVLISKGLANDDVQAMQILRGVRPKVRLTGPQKRQLSLASKILCKERVHDVAQR